jgi:hypothetical protein
VLVRRKAERWKSFSWAFVVVEGRDEGQFLLAVAGRTKNGYGDESGGGCGVFYSFYCSVSPEILMKHTRSSIGIR